MESPTPEKRIAESPLSRGNFMESSSSERHSAEKPPTGGRLLEIPSAENPPAGGKLLEMPSAEMRSVESPSAGGHSTESPSQDERVDQSPPPPMNTDGPPPGSRRRRGRKRASGSRSSRPRGRGDRLAVGQADHSCGSGISHHDARQAQQPAPSERNLAIVPGRARRRGHAGRATVSPPRAADHPGEPGPGGLRPWSGERLGQRFRRERIRRRAGCAPGARAAAPWWPWRNGRTNTGTLITEVTMPASATARP